MKKMILAIVAIMMMTAAQAQDNNLQNGRERRNFDRTEMIKKRTDDVVKKYGLSEEQATKLLSLNTKFAGNMGPGMRGMRGGRGGARQRPRPNFGAGNADGQRPEMTEEMREQMQKAREERQQAMKQYDTELQTIMTPDQYKAYQADQAEMRKNGFRRGQRGANSENNK